MYEITIRYTQTGNLIKMYENKVNIVIDFVYKLPEEIVQSLVYVTYNVERGKTAKFIPKFFPTTFSCLGKRK